MVLASRDDAKRDIQTRVWVAMVMMGAIALLGWSSSEGDPSDFEPYHPEFRLDPNSADPSLLEVLPGLGPSKVDAIVMERQNAPLGSLTELEERVKGIGPSFSARLKPYLRFPNAPRP